MVTSTTYYSIGVADPVTHFQILSKDPGNSAEFYSKLFGWSVAAPDAIGYRAVQTGSTEGIQGGIWQAPPQAGSFVQLFVSVNDVSAAATQAKDLGAKVLVPPMKLPGGDEMAVLLDPLGMSFAIVRRA